MTPEVDKKANQLINRFFDSVDEHTDCDCHPVGGRMKAAKVCALICVDEIMAANVMGGPITMYPDTVFESESLIGGTEFWKQVKQAILSL